ncbi:MAG: hypothetical protein KF716_25375 [Anaerolineae bacterium]|nr:hypothetical protein [Anaerolineae bacterium]
MSTLDELFAYIFEGMSPAFRPEFEGWVRESRRFRAFAISYRSKIRAKLKNVRDEAGMSDVRAELETAMLLLREERFTLEYEKYTAARQRGPDYTVTFKTHTPFNVEVRRIRTIEVDEKDSNATLVKLMAVLCDKVGQMPPSIINLLWLTAEREISEEDLTRTVLTLRQLAERKVEEFFTRRGFESAADFLKQYRQLSGIVLREATGTVVWLNALARHAAPPEIINAIRRLERA